MASKAKSEKDTREATAGTGAGADAAPAALDAATLHRKGRKARKAAVESDANAVAQAAAVRKTFPPGTAVQVGPIRERIRAREAVAGRDLEAISDTELGKIARRMNFRTKDGTVFDAAATRTALGRILAAK